MDIAFQTSKLERICNDSKLLARNFGSERAKLIRRRLDDMKDAVNLEVIRTLPGAACHELTGDRKGQLALSVKHPFRLIIEPANVPTPLKPDGGLDWAGVTAVRVIEVIDYHGK